MMRNGVQRAATVTKTCPMHEPACAAKVAEHISAFYGPGFDVAAPLERACGRFVRGAHKGELRGWASIEVVTEGGWKKHGPGYRNGNVVRPNTVLGVRITDFTGKTYLEVGG